MNPSATQQHHARSMMHQMQARASPDNYSSSYNFLQLSTTILQVAEDDVSIFTFKQR